MNYKKIFLTLLIILAIAYLLYFFLFPWDEKEVYMNVKIENVLGFYINETALMFGTIPPGGIGSKNVTLYNELETPEFVHITAAGNISRWTRVSDNNFFLLGKTTKPLQVRIYVPQEAGYGEYEGILKISIKKLFW